MRPSRSQKEWLTGLADRYAEAMTPDVLSYLDARGIDRDAVHGYRLGVVSEPDPSHERFQGRLSIPYITPSGVVHIRFRCIEDHGGQTCSDLFHGKYESPAGEETRLYNVNALHDSSDVIGVCEGELDAEVATMTGLPSVGVPGVTNWKPFYYRLFDDYDRVILLGDGDAAGREFVATLARNLPNSFRRPMPTNHDVSSYVVENGPKEFLSYIFD